MKLPFFKRAFVDRLRTQAAANLASYGPDPAWLDSFSGSEPYVSESSMVVDPPPELVCPPDGDCAVRDADNAILIYEWLKKLTPALAMEERLWACLTHVQFSAYMAKRWPAKDDGLVRRRYLFENGTFAALARNGIARLWWAAHLTRDPSRVDPYELTKVLFLRQDIQLALMERSLGKCAPVRTAVLDYLSANYESLREQAFGRRIQLLMREVNLLGGVTMLDALTRESLQSELGKIGPRVVAMTQRPVAGKAPQPEQGAA